MCLPFEVLVSPPSDPEKNMETDIFLLEDLKRHPRVVLHLYAWKGLCATYGYFLHPFRLLKQEQVKKHDLKLARRPTGGGLIFHSWDLAFALLIPGSHPHYFSNTLQSYLSVNQAVLKAITQFNKTKISPTLWVTQDKNQRVDFCMAQPTVFDIMIEGKKVGGAAQRRTKHGLLHQGSIALGMPSLELLEDLLLDCQQVIPAMQRQGHYLLGQNIKTDFFHQERQRLQFLLIKSLQKQYQ